MNIQQFKDRVFEVGRSAGLEDMEVYVSQSKEFSVRIFKTEIDDYSVSSVQGVGFRASYKGKVGYAYAEILDETSVDLLVSSAKANAEVIDSKDEIVFFPGSPSYPEVTAYNDELSSVSPEERIEFARELEARALAADSRVDLVNWAMTGYEESEIYIANTKGLEQSFVRNGGVSYVSAVVRDGEQVKTGSRFQFGNDWSKFDAEKLAQAAVNEGVSLLNADTVPSGEYRVMLRYDAARDMVQTFSSVFSGEAVQKGLSLLAGKLGQKIASSKVTLVDDPLMPNGGASIPFDGEGVASKTKKVIDQGQLTTYLHNLKTAKKDGVESTGNASRASFKSPVGISPTNFYIKPGETSYEDLLKELDDGLVIIDVQGLHSGANPVSGDFSLGAYGYLVEGGQIVRPVDQITVAGNFFRMIEDIEVIGSDLEFGIPGYGGNVGSPSLIVRSLSIAGK